jgi:pyruvate kinase
MDQVQEDSEVIKQAVAHSLSEGLIAKGERVVVVAGSVGRVGGTDLMQVVEV